MRRTVPKCRRGRPSCSHSTDRKAGSPQFRCRESLPLLTVAGVTHSALCSPCFGGGACPLPPYQRGSRFGSNVRHKDIHHALVSRHPLKFGLFRSETEIVIDPNFKG